MQWEKLTAVEFARAVKESQGVTVVSVGVIEAHASHLPLGTDMLDAHWVACRAAEREPAIVFPAYPFGVNIETTHLPGGVSLHRELLFTLLENICDEIARNGLEKIILHNGHGGNRYFLPLFVQMLTAKDKPYVVYYANLPSSQDPDILETDELGHACEWETSKMLYIYEELVKMDQAPSRPFKSLRRNQELDEAGAYSPVDWYSMYPVMYVGDASKATAEKGKAFVEFEIDALVKFIRTIKADKITSKLQKEFIKKRHDPSVPDEWD